MAAMARCEAVQRRSHETVVWDGLLSSPKRSRRARLRRNRSLTLGRTRAYVGVQRATPTPAIRTQPPGCSLSTSQHPALPLFRTACSRRRQCPEARADPCQTGAPSRTLAKRDPTERRLSAFRIRRGLIGSRAFFARSSDRLSARRTPQGHVAKPQGGRA
jgi:hypothetical protein